MSMLDRTDNKPLVNVPDTSKFGNWEEFSKELFAKCLDWPDGPIHSNENIRLISANLVEFIESISYLELTSFEIRDIRDFFKSYELLLGALEAGPRKPNGLHLSIFKPKVKPYETFASEAKKTIDAISESLTKVETQSRQAQEIRANGLDTEMKGSDPQIKSKVGMTGELLHGLENLRRISQGKPIEPIPTTQPDDINKRTPTERDSIKFGGDGSGPMGLAS